MLFQPEHQLKVKLKQNLNKEEIKLADKQNGDTHTYGCTYGHTDGWEDVKPYQVKTTVVNCTTVQVRVLRILTNHRRDFGLSNMYVVQIKKTK